MSCFREKKNTEISTVTQTKSEWKDGYFSEKVHVTTGELLQTQDTFYVRDQRPVTKHLPLR